MAKVKKPAMHQHDQNVVSVTAAATPGPTVSVPAGLVKVTSASSGFITLADGDYNGQKVLLYSEDTSNDTSVLDSSGTAIKGQDQIDVTDGVCLVCYYYHDGESGSWYGVLST